MFAIKKIIFFKFSQYMRLIKIIPSHVFVIFRPKIKLASPDPSYQTASKHIFSFIYNMEIRAKY
jgi:hypothetical protein